MPPLRNQRRELFCQNVVKNAKNGMNLTEAYRASGYRGEGHVAEVGGSRLMSNVEVRMRVNELTRPAVAKARITVESLLAELETTIVDARGAKQHSVVVRSLELAAKLVGLLRDRVEVGSPSEFAGLETSEQIYRAIVDEVFDGDPGAALAALDEMRVGIEACAADRARDVRG
jgi:hypothetical protein